MGSGYWQDLTTTDFDSLDPLKTVALLPVAAIEQHGPHLPLSTDTLISEAIVTATLPILPENSTVLVLPTMTVGSSLEHIDFPGTLTVNAENLLALWKAVGSSVSRVGIRKLVIFNSHGGQSALVDIAALHLRVEMQMLVVRANYFSFGAPTGLFKEEELLHGLHGGEVETSLIMHLRPDLVRANALNDFPGLPSALASRNEFLGVESPVGFGWMSQDLNPAGVCGNASNADPERGATYLQYVANCLARLLIEVIDTPLSIIEQKPST
jgi:creatinine amidohydrolase|tara:strand:- start:22 stop:825 length:804 start_codon:yes stop_codon:yes gene_type:complete